MKPTERCLSVVIPVYNEAATIRAVLASVIRSPYVQEVLVVDDASTDGTRELLKAHENGESALVTDKGPAKIRIFFQPENRGKGRLRIGIAQAIAPFLIVQDADLEYDPADYEKMLEPLLSGQADAVYGSRFLGEQHRVLYFWHSIANRFLTFLSNVCTDLNLTDMETCYKAFSTEMIQGISLRSNRFGFEPEITAKIAKLRCTVYEVPISYRGRGYNDGKKITWKDGVSTVWTIFKYWLIDDLYQETAGLRTLRIMEGAGRYNSWLFTLCKPYIGNRVVEVGSGVGNITKFLLDREHVVATDVDDYYLDQLKRSFGSRDNFSLEKLDLSNADQVRRIKSTHTPTSVVCMNVLEHVKDDRQAVGNLQALLSSGGRLVVVVPAHQWLFSPMDVCLGHYRRYSQKQLTGILKEFGFEIEKSCYVNWLGALGWFVNGRVFRRKLIPSRQLRFFDWLIGLLAIERVMAPPFGLSVLVVATKR